MRYPLFPIVTTMGLMLLGCGQDQSGTDADLGAGNMVPGLDAFQVEPLSASIQILSSDEFEGRGPSSPGEEKTVEYLIQQFQEAGLEPGNGDSFTQQVPLVSITVENEPELSLSSPAGQEETYTYGSDFVAWTTRVRPAERIAGSELVFVGYGVVAPEYGWNDYAGLDVGGKTVVILVNDPGFATQDDELFNGNTMTYYGRWTYKFEEAARQGAAAAIVVHEPGPAGYPWEVVSGSWTGPQFGLVASDNNMSRIAIEGWITRGVADRLFEMAGQSYEDLKARAAQADFEGVPLGVTASVRVENRIERSTSNNVIGVLPGSIHPEETVIYTAHWDHLGMSEDPSLEDRIFNGALDNASGTAGLIQIAKAFGQLQERPARSLVFLAVTAEEQGLLGSAHYASNPIYPTASTVATINMDGLNLVGPMRDITVVGFGNSELDDYLEAAAEEVSRYLRPDPEPEKGFYYRSDHFNFAKVGVPSLYTDQGIDHVDRGEEYGLAQREDYTVNRYHKPSDEFDPNWDLRGALDDLKLLYTVGFRLAETDQFPNWREGNEFKAIRDNDRSDR